MTRFTALLAAALLSSLGAQAQAQPLRHDLLAQCPQLAAELPELLASAKQQVQRDAVVRAQLRIDADGRLHIESLQGDRQYLGAVRRALQDTNCGAPLAAGAQRQVLNIRFEDPLTPSLPTHYATR